jgi:PAS domain S-box-containing protein
VHFRNRVFVAGAMILLLLASPVIAAASKHRAKLTDAELTWVNAHATLKVGNELDWPPFDFAKKKEPKGFSIDLIRLAARKVGLEIVFVNGFSWQQLMAMFRAGSLDVLPAIFSTEERRKFIAFTEPYISNPSVLAIHAKNTEALALSDLDGKRVAVIQGYATAQALEARHPKILRLSVKDAVAGLEAVSIGQADAFIGTLGVISYALEKNAIPNIRIAGDSGLKKPEEIELRMGVAKQNTILRDILQKGLNAVTPNEMKAIRDRWMPLKAQEEITARPSDDLLVWWALGIAFAVLAGAIILGQILDRPVSEKDLERMTGARRFWLAVTFSNLKISAKILIVLVAVAASSVGAFGIMEYQATKESLRRESFNKLTVVRELKAQQIEDYFKTISNQVVTFSESRTVTEAMRAFRETFKALEAKAMAEHGAEKPDPKLIAYYRDEYFARLKPNTVDELDGVEAVSFIPKSPQARHLQELYLAKNPNPTGEKYRLDDAGDGSAYSAAHRVYHPIIRSFLEKFDYYDIFLIDPKTGEVVYSVFKEVDYGTSLLTGLYKDTNLARVFRAARNAAAGDFVRLEDFEPYYPSYNAPASFIGSPIFDGDEKIGVLVFQMPIERINNIMTSHQAWKDVGLGESGETYIVGDDFLMRNQSRFLIEDREKYLGMIRSIGVPEDTVRRIKTFNSTIGLQRVETRGTREALSGRVNTEIFPGYRGVSVLSSYRPLRLSDVRWVVMSEIDEAEAFAPVDALKTRMLLLMGLFLTAILGISFVFARTMTRPIKVLTAKAESLAKGDLDVVINTGGGDEISHLARSFDVMRESLKDHIGDLEEKVRERTAVQRAIMDSAQDAIICMDDSGHVILWNPAAENMFGRSNEDMLGIALTEIIPERHRGAHEEGIRRLRMNEVPRVVGKAIELTALREDGSEFPIELSIGTWTIGERRYFSGVIRDITERKNAEKALADQLVLLEENRSELRLTLDQLESVNSVIFHWNPQGLITGLNRYGQELFGFAESEILGQHIVGTIIAKGGGVERDLEGMIDDILAHPENYLENENQNIRKDGSAVWMLWMNKPITTEDGSLEEILSVGINITDRKELERDLAIANKRMGDELNIGAEIQMSMIPLTFPRFPEHKEIDVWAYLRPAREVGGDFYDFFFIKEHLFGFVVADVSGKGVPAALLMAVAKTLLKANAQDTTSTAKIIERTNNELSQNNQDCMFITTFFGIFDTKTGVMTYTNAGHNPPYLLSPDGSVNSLHEVHGPMIGVREGLAYEQAEVQLGVDDKLVLYTDGITEAFNSDGQAFGDDRLPEMLGRSANLGTKYLVDAVVRDVDEFAGDAEQSDDVTVFCLRYVAWEERDDSARIELHLTNEMVEIERALKALSEFSDQYDLPPDVQNDVGVVLDDLLNNIISHAFEDEDDHLIAVTLAADKQRFIVTVSDDGVEFDPFLRAEPDIESGIQDRQIGGLGIHLIRNLMDDLSYRRIDGRNVTTLMKRMGE